MLLDKDRLRWDLQWSSSDVVLCCILNSVYHYQIQQTTSMESCVLPCFFEHGLIRMWNMSWVQCWLLTWLFYYGEVQLLWDFNTLRSRQLLQCILWLKTIISYSKCHWIVMLNVSLNTSSLTMEWRISCNKLLIKYSLNCHKDQRLLQRKFLWRTFRECVISQNYIHLKTVISWP